MRQAGQSILGDVRGDVGKMRDKGGEKEAGDERQEVKMKEARYRRSKRSRSKKQDKKR